MSQPAQTSRRRTTFIAIVLLIVLTVLGLGLHRDYGISWDEPVQRRYGEKVYRYIAAGDESLLKDRHRVYGPAFE